MPKTLRNYLILEFYLILVSSKFIFGSGEGLGIDPRWCHWGNFSVASHNSMCLGSTQPLKMSTRILLGVKTVGAYV
jgi:hypothetical protein